MAADWDVTGYAGRVDVLEAHWTVRTRHILHTLRKNGLKRGFSDKLNGDYFVPVLEQKRQTHVAFFAVEEAGRASDPADAASLAMELVLVLVVEEVTLQAGVL